MDTFASLVDYARYHYDNAEPEDLSTESKVMPFYNKNINPDITFDFYMRRIVKYSDITPNIMLMCFLLLKRFNRKYSINSRNFYRLFLIANFVVMKLVDDFHHGVEFIATLGGLQKNKSEIVHLELLFLKSIDWDLSITQAHLDSLGYSMDGDVTMN